MNITLIRPVLLRPGSIAREEDAAIVRAAIPAIQAWFDSRGVTVHVADPRQPWCEEPPEWFAGAPGGLFYAAQAWAVQRGHGRGNEKALFILSGYPAGRGEAGLSVAVVGYGVLADLASGDEERRNGALWLVSHEIGHLMGLKHTSEPADLMSEISSKERYPAVTLAGMTAAHA